MTTGVLLANLGTPDAPTTKAVRRYLREFLWDPRVIDLPRWKWWLILNLFVLTTRPSKSADAYRKVWTDEGSPLLVTGQKQASGLAERLSMPVALGMRYGNPSLAAGLEDLQDEGCDRICLLPLYPQYSRTTTESTFDVARTLDIAGLVTIDDYHDDPGYIASLAASVKEAWQESGRPERLLLSFHGIPQRYAADGDPYPGRCEKTAKLLAEALRLKDDEWTLSYQSRFGAEEWLHPYTDETLEQWGRRGLKSVDVACPGFAADCLETLEEIAVGNRATFEQAGGGRYRYLPALNDRPDHLDALAAVVERALGLTRSY